MNVKDILLGIVSVIVGFVVLSVVVLVLSMLNLAIFPDPTLFSISLEVVSGFLAGFVGGYLCHRITTRYTQNSGRLFTSVLAVLLGVLGLVTFLSYLAAEFPENQPEWFQPVVTVVGIMGILLGGYMNHRTAEASS